MTGAAPRGRTLGVFVGMGVLYAALALGSRLVALAGNGAVLVWPAAGVALVWLLHETAQGRARWCVLAQTAILTVVLAATGASAPLVATAVVAAVTQTVLAVELLRRWCPASFRPDGLVSIHTADSFSGALAAVLVASLAGTAIGGTGLAAQSGAFVLMDYVSWWVRNVTGLVVVGGVGLLVWEHAKGQGARRMQRRQVPELLALVVGSAATYGYAFTQSDLPLTFLAGPWTVWAALRFPTALAAVHTALFGGVAVTLTLLGHGPLGRIGDPASAAILAQAFLSVTMLVAIAVASGRDQSSVLLAELAGTQRAAVERAEMLDAMTEAMTEGVVIVAPGGQVVRMNAACRALLSDTAAGAAARAGDYELRRSDGSPLPPDERPTARAFREGQVPPYDVQLVLRDGGTRVLEVTAATLRTEAGARALLVYRDVTRERQDRSDLAHFASAVAHELRAPLTAIKGGLGVASLRLSGVVETIDDDRTLDSLASALGDIEQADRSIVKVSRLIQELLDQATAEGRALGEERVELGGYDGVVHEVAELLPPGAAVEVGALPEVFADADLVRQLLGNLLDNAVKYAAPDRPLRVSVTGVRMDDRVRVDVTDNGVGIPPEERDRVFERFHRAHAGDPRFSGTGLGLALCRTIVERHGGVIECLPTPAGIGSTFRFDLPSADGAGPDGRQSPDRNELTAPATST